MTNHFTSRLDPETDEHLLARMFSMNDESDIAKIWTDWEKKHDLDDITWSDLVLATAASSMYQDAETILFPPRIVGNSKRCFLTGTRLKQVADELLGLLTSQRIPAYALRETALVQHDVGTIWYSSFNQIDLYVPRTDIARAGQFMKSAGWKASKEERIAIQLTRDGIKVRLTCQLSPHWDSTLHSSFTGINHPGLRTAIDLLSQIGIGSGQSIAIRKGQLWWLLLSPFTETQRQDLRTYTKAFLISNILNDFNPQGISISPLLYEKSLNDTYRTYIARPSRFNKIRYHHARYNALRQVLDTGVGPFEYIIDTRRNRQAIT